jgi:hypothetical protein
MTFLAGFTTSSALLRIAFPVVAIAYFPGIADVTTANVLPSAASAKGKNMFTYVFDLIASHPFLRFSNIT